MSADYRNAFSPGPPKPEADVRAAAFVSQMWWYAFSVLYPAQALKSMGLYPRNSIGRYPSAAPSKGEGQFYCLQYREPVYLDCLPDDHQSVEEFNRWVELYEISAAPFTQPVFQETIKLMRPHLPRAARILDVSCGPGTELIQLAASVPDGEAVGVDLSAGMVAAAFAKAQRMQLHNTAFFQADVNKLPDHFTGRFDAVYCSFAFHHYRDPAVALEEMRRTLNRDGRAFVVDPGAWWFNLLSAPFAKWADPGWVGFHTGEEFGVLFRDAGFSTFYWEEILPGIGVCIGTR